MPCSPNRNQAQAEGHIIRGTPPLTSRSAAPLSPSPVLGLPPFKTGGLRLVFDSGLHLNVEPRPDFEAWSVTSPGMTATAPVARP
ncbi:DUF6188 family protein [Nonomuraea guangzhouensis]